MEHLQRILLVDLLTESLEDAIMLKNERASVSDLLASLVTSSLLIN